MEEGFILNKDYSNPDNEIVSQYKTTNENIENNQYIKFNSKGITKITTPKSLNSEEGSTAEFIGKDNLIPLSHILADIT